MFKEFPTKSAEEVIYHFMNIPYQNQINMNLFTSSKKPKNAVALTVDQREALNTMIASDISCIDDYNSPIIQHASVYKMLLDKIKFDESHKNAENQPFKHERDAEVDNIITDLTKLSKDEKETIMDLTEHLQDNSKDLKQRAEDKIRSLLKVLIELQLRKIEMKVGFLDEYEKSMYHEMKLIDLYKHHLQVDRIKQDLESANS